MYVIICVACVSHGEILKVYDYTHFFYKNNFIWTVSLKFRRTSEQVKNIWASDFEKIKNIWSSGTNISEY